MAYEKGLRDFLDHLNKTVLVDQQIEVNDENFKDGKRGLILKFVQKCHPDRQTEKEAHIKLLFREITQMLNEVFVEYKWAAKTTNLPAWLSVLYQNEEYQH